MPGIQNVKKKISNHRFAVFLFLLLSLLIVPPYFADLERVGFIFKGMLTAVLVWALWTVTSNRRAMLLAIVLLVPTVVSTWLAYATSMNRQIAYVDNFTNIIYFGLICIYLAIFIARSRRVNAEVLFASMCLYISLAVLWAAIFTNLELFYNPAFSFYGSTAVEADIGHNQLFDYMVYYSFVTLSTLGYGDIIPVHRVAQNWAAVEAMVGQFFIAIVIARLVSLYTLEQGRHNEN